MSVILTVTFLLVDLFFNLQHFWSPSSQCVFPRLCSTEKLFSLSYNTEWHLIICLPYFHFFHIFSDSLGTILLGLNPMGSSLPLVVDNRWPLFTFQTCASQQMMHSCSPKLPSPSPHQEKMPLKVAGVSDGSIACHGHSASISGCII